ncbi:MAG TPA: hypothetical protein VF077_08765 [Nitrospiraceae bacterium]
MGQGGPIGGGGQAQTVALPQRWPIIVMPSNRQDDTNKDARLINAFIEREPQGDIWLYKRPGFLKLTQPSGNPGVCQGCYNWRGDIYAIVDGHLYQNGVDKGGTINTTNGVYDFTSTMGVDAVPAKLTFSNGVTAFAYCDSIGLEQFTGNLSFPQPYAKGIAYLDSVTYLMTLDAEIFGSPDENDVTGGPWDPLDVVVAQSEPSRGVYLSKQLVYIVAFKELSTEMFYDAGNAEGSALSPVSGAKVNFGCINPNSVRDLDGALFWLCTNESAAVQVIKMENLKVEIVSTPAIERLLANADYTTVYSWTLKLEGHKWYAITLVNNNLTLVYDATTGIWAQWTDVAGNYLPFIDSTFKTDTAQTILQHATDGWLYTVSLNNVVDDGDNLINVGIITQNYDGGTARDKTLKTIYFDASQTNGSRINVRFSDDDYQTWSAWRPIDLSIGKPMLINLGTFKRRAFHINHACRTKFRMKAMDFQVDIGTL